MSELLLTIAIFGILAVGLSAFAVRRISGALMRKVRDDSLTPQDLSALRDAADELVRRIEEATNASIARLEAKERELRELLQTRDVLILSSSDASESGFSERA